MSKSFEDYVGKRRPCRRCGGTGQVDRPLRVCIDCGGVGKVSVTERPFSDRVSLTDSFRLAYEYGVLCRLVWATPRNQVLAEQAALWDGYLATVEAYGEDGVLLDEYEYSYRDGFYKQS